MLGLQIFDNASTSRTMLWDFSSRAKDVTLSTNAHGFAALTCLVPLSLTESFQVYDRAGLPHVVVSDNGAIVWEGRLEDVAIVNGGVRLGAFGYQRTLSDAPYTALWSVTSVADWFEVDSGIISPNTNDRYQLDNNNRLYITPQKNSTQGTTTTTKVGRWGYAAPHLGERNMAAASFSYELLAPANWYGQLYSWGTVPYPIGGSVWSGPAQEWSLQGNGSVQTGSTAITLSQSAPGLNFQLYYNAADAAYAAETGANYLKITNLRLKTTTSGSVFADEIAKALVSFVNGVNSAQLQNITTLVESPGIDLLDESYEDRLPGDILNYLTGLGDNQTTPRQWEWGVWENRTMHFRPRGNAARAWYVDVSALEIERTIETLTNSVYAKYQDAGGRTLRTAASADSASVARYGVTRRQALSVQTTSSAQAGTHRDAALQDGKDPMPRSAVVFQALYDASGGRWPLWMARSGDTITIRNLPPTLSTSIDRIRTFRVAETEYRADDNTLTVTPESPLPSLDTLAVREENQYKSATPRE